MREHTKHVINVAIVLAVLAIGAGTFAYSGLYNIGADDAHTRPVYSMLQMLRERSITARADKLHPPPNLNDSALIRQGAGNYNAMCASCHLGPGMEETELSKGLYPAPPNLSKAGVADPSHHFWVIKHGIKASGMPAWGGSMSDAYIWGMVAFLQQLPKLNAAQYKALVASGGGHSHGGGESGGGAQEVGAADPQDGTADNHGDMAGMDMSSGETAEHSHAAATGGVIYTDADRTREMHPAPKPSTKSATTKPTAKGSTTDEHAGMAMPGMDMPATTDSTQTDDHEDHQH